MFDPNCGMLQVTLGKRQTILRLHRRGYTSAVRHRRVRVVLAPPMKNAMNWTATVTFVCEGGCVSFGSGPHSNPQAAVDEAYGRLIRWQITMQQTIEGLNS